MVLVRTHDGKYAPAFAPVKPRNGVSIGPVDAKKLMEKLGEGIFDIIEQSSARLGK
jgi:hypothetical protein